MKAWVFTVILAASLTACSQLQTPDTDGAEDAKGVLAEFWRIQNSHDYRRLSELFHDEAVFVDPVYGIFEGRGAIAAFLARVTEDMAAQNTTFGLERLEGSGAVAFAQWWADTPAGKLYGVGVYKVKAGKIIYYRDYMNPPDHGASPERE